MPEWIFKKATILVKRYDRGPGQAAQYHLWLEEIGFPYPPGCTKVEIHLPSGWEPMSFNASNWSKGTTSWAEGVGSRKRGCSALKSPRATTSIPSATN